MVIGLLVWKGVPGMIGKMLDQRAAVIAAELEEAKRLRAEAAALLADYSSAPPAPRPKPRASSADAKAEAARFRRRIPRRAGRPRSRAAPPPPGTRSPRPKPRLSNEIRGLAADAAVDAAQKLIAGAAGREAAPRV